MSNNENDYLNKLFASSSDMTDEAEVEFPLVDVPETLNKKLHAIASSSNISTKPAKLSRFANWPKVTSIAASLLIAVMGVQFYQQQQTLKQLEAAQADLATALHYLGEANRITREHVRSSLNDNMRKARVSPALEFDIERDAAPKANPETTIPTRTL